MSTITREKLRELARAKVKSLEFSITHAAFADSRAELEEELELARIALASLEAEAVGFIARHKETGKFGSYLHPKADWFKNDDYEVLSAYTSPPAPVSVPVEVSWEDVPDEITEDDMEVALAWAHGFNQCRAAMLQGAEPVTTANKLPDGFDFDRFNDVVWLEAVASNPHMHSLTTSTISMVALELNKRLEAGNSPVIPDGWVACTERMPDDEEDVLCFGQYGDNDIDEERYQFMGWLSRKGIKRVWRVSDGDSQNRRARVTHWMPLPAAPQQEAKNV